MSQQRDYYEVLGIARSATDKEIKDGFIRAARLYHPDRNLNDADGAKTRFQEAEQAYTTLSDPQKRAAYDRFGVTQVNNNFSDFDPFGIQLKKRCFEEALQHTRDGKMLNKNVYGETSHYYDAIQHGLKINKKNDARQFYRYGSPGFYAGTDGLDSSQIESLMQLWDQRSQERIAQELPALLEEKERYLPVLTAHAEKLRSEINTLRAAINENEETKAMLKAYVNPVSILFADIKRAIDNKLSADGENAVEKKYLASIKKRVDIMRKINAAPGPHIADQWQEISNLIKANVTDWHRPGQYLAVETMHQLQYGNLTPNNIIDWLNEKKLAPGILNGKKRANLSTARQKIIDLIPRIQAITDHTVRDDILSDKQSFDKKITLYEEQHAASATELAEAQRKSAIVYAEAVKSAAKSYIKRAESARYDWQIILGHRVEIKAAKLSDRGNLGGSFSSQELAVLSAIENNLALPATQKTLDAMNHFTRDRMYKASLTISSDAVSQWRRLEKTQEELVKIEKICNDLAQEAKDPAQLKALRNTLSEAGKLIETFPQSGSEQPPQAKAVRTGKWLARKL